jgi:hypothetical protein
MVGVSLAHITPPVTLLSDREAVLGMTDGATKFFVREVRLTSTDRDRIAQQWHWQPEDEIYRFYLGRNNVGQLVAAVTFLTEFTIHGPVRVAVALGPDGTVRDAKVVELTEETFSWLKPLIDHDFTRAYIGRGSRASFRMGEGMTQPASQSMAQFYGDIVTSLIQRAAVLFEVTVLQRDNKS